MKFDFGKLGVASSPDKKLESQLSQRIGEEIFAKMRWNSLLDKELKFAIIVGISIIYGFFFSWNSYCLWIWHVIYIVYSFFIFMGFLLLINFLI